MKDWQRVLGVIAVVIAGVLVLRWFANSSVRNSTASAASGGGSGPAYLDTAADNSISVVGVPEESSCSEPRSGPAEGPASCS
jgi:hypothetical protein